MPINIPAVSDVQHRRRLLAVVNVINDTIDTYPYAPTSAAGQFKATCRSRIGGKMTDGVSHAQVMFGGKLLQLFQRTT
jgi:hypothetical protein